MSDGSQELLLMTCERVPGDTPPMSRNEASELMPQIPAWEITEDGLALTREFRFPDFQETMNFVNATANIANEQDHHPDLAVSYSTCRVTWSTHSIGGLSISDLICAAKTDRLLDL